MSTADAVSALSRPQAPPRLLPADWSRRRRAKNTLIFWAVRVALGCARVLPIGVLVACGRALGVVAWHLARSARALAIANASRVFGADQGRAIARRSFVVLGGFLGDALALFRSRHRALDRIVFSGQARDVLARASSHGRGVVLVTGHFGPWERLAAAIVERGFSLTTPVRPSYDPRLEWLVHAPLRARRGVRALDRDAPSTPIALVRALRAGGVVGLLVDVDTRVASVDVPFLDRDAATPIAPARLALRTGAPLVLALAREGGVEVTLVRDAAPPARQTTDDEVRALTAEISSRLGAAIRAEPDRWIWMHDRWRASTFARR